MVGKAEVFCEWVAETFGPDSFYTATPEIIRDIKRRWDHWEVFLIQRGLWSYTAEELRDKLRMLSHEQVIEIGEALQKRERQIFSRR